MMKSSRKKWSFRDILLFFASFLTTVVVLGGGMLYFFSGLFGIEPIKNVGDSVAKELLPRRQYLICLTDTDVCYEVYIDFHREEAGVRRLYIDVSHFGSGGLSKLTKEAEKTGSKYDGALAFTETQLAAAIDYVGGVALNVDKRISAICGGITLGYGSVSGIAAIKIFEDEKENELLCLTLTEEILNKWCLILQDKRSFFRLLDISVNNLSYANYLPIQEYFSRFRE